MIGSGLLGEELRIRDETPATSVDACCKTLKNRRKLSLCNPIARVACTECEESMAPSLCARRDWTGILGPQYRSRGSVIGQECSFIDFDLFSSLPAPYQSRSRRLQILRAR